MISKIRIHAYTNRIQSDAEEEYIRKCHSRERALMEIPYDRRNGKTLPSLT